MAVESIVPPQTASDPVLYKLNNQYSQSEIDTRPKLIARAVVTGLILVPGLIVISGLALIGWCYGIRQNRHASGRPPAAR